MDNFGFPRRSDAGCNIHRERHRPVGNRRARIEETRHQARNPGHAACIEFLKNPKRQNRPLRVRNHAGRERLQIPAFEQEGGRAALSQGHGQKHRLGVKFRKYAPHEVFDVWITHRQVRIRINDRLQPVKIRIRARRILHGLVQAFNTCQDNTVDPVIHVFQGSQAEVAAIGDAPEADRISAKMCPQRLQVSNAFLRRVAVNVDFFRLPERQAFLRRKFMSQDVIRIAERCRVRIELGAAAGWQVI